IAAPASVITAFVSEYFGGSQNGLGSRIVGNIALSNNAEAWAYVVGACLLGLTFYLVALVLERGGTPGGGGLGQYVQSRGRRPAHPPRGRGHHHEGDAAQVLRGRHSGTCARRRGV